MTRSLRLGAFLSLLAATALTVPAASAGPPPSGGPEDGARGPAGGVQVGGQGSGYLGFPPGGEYDPTTSDDPNFISGAPDRPSDQTYGPRGASGEEPGGYDIVDVGYGSVEAGYGATIPDFHVVEKGDTLWAIGDRYYRDPYMWPRLWSFNEQITNAHWIFPGDRIRLTDPNESSSPQEGLRGPSLSYRATEKRKELENQTYVLERWAYVSDEEFEDSMEIVGGAEAKVMLSTLDTAYVGFEPENPPIAGERLAVYRPIVAVHDLEIKGKKQQRKKKGDKIGYVVEIVGEVYITEIAKKSAEAQVVDSVRPIERKMRVGELQTRFSRIDPVPADSSDVGRIVYITRDQDLVGEKQFAVVNLGAERGVRRGNILDVVHKGDEYSAEHSLVTPYEEGHPRRVVGRLLVVQVQEKSALTVAIETSKELLLGDPVELRGPDMDDNDADRVTARDGGKTRASGEASGSREGGKAEGKAGFQLGQ